VPQNPYFPPQNTVKEILEYGVDKLNYRYTQPMLHGITHMMNLSEQLDRQVVTLSGGEKRKLALARALLQQPLLLLLDEPLNNLDTISKHELREEIATIHRYLDITVIHVTHDQSEALTLADRIAVIRSGRLVTKGTVEHVYNNPAVEYAARFLGYQNVYDVSSVEPGRSSSKIKVGNIILRSSNHMGEDQKKVAIHGSEVILHRKTPVNMRDNLFQSEVKRIVTTGPTAYITVDFGLQMILTMGRRAYKASNLQVGESVWVQFSTDAVKPIKV
jgi:ABC-type Fe3+/spermidine/putrescine transport system ATPase subunit